MAYNTRSSVYKVFLSTIQAIVPHVIFTREFHVPNSRWKSLNAKFTRSFHMKFTWGTIGCEHSIYYGFSMIFFQECVFSSVIDYRYAVYRVWMRIYFIIWQYLTKLVYLIVMIQMLDVFTLWKKVYMWISMIINMK